MSFEDDVKKLLVKFPVRVTTEFYPSGSVIFDALMGGGLPKGTYIELASPSGLGKSTMALHFAKTLCSMGHNVHFLDFEQGLNQSQLDGVGLTQYRDKKFFPFQPITFSDGEEILDQVLPYSSLVIVDSITSILPDKLASQSVTEVEPGLKARLEASMLLKYKSQVRKTGATMIFINQMRTKIRFRGSSTEEPAGGNALRFYCDVRFMMREDRMLSRTQDTLSGRVSVPYGADVRVWALKNRYARPFVEGVVTVFFGKGISNLSAYVAFLRREGAVVQGGGGHYTIRFKDQEHKVRGEKGLLTWAKDNVSELRKYVESRGGFLLVKDGDEE